MARTPRLFMWAGGKGKMLAHYAPHLPERLPEGGYAEPFAGGAALFAHLRRERGAFPATLGDTNAEVVRLYEEVRDAPARLIGNLRPYAEAWADRSPQDRKRFYYDVRAEYWGMPEGPAATAALYFLMRTGFNGIWQTCADSRGRYGTPVGLTDKPARVVDETAIAAWSGYLAGARLSALPYERQPEPEDAFVFCDPPYRDSFTRYGTDFDDAAQERLVAWCRRTARERGCLVWLANRDAGDGFFERAAPDARLLRFPVTYTAGRRKRTEDGFEAKPATELLMIWEPGSA